MELSKDTLFAGRYRLLQERGRGSFGEVWLARDEQLDMDVAVKVYIALDDRGIEDFKKEYKTAYNLNHPNLLHAYHFDICERRPFLVMPFCPSSALSLLGQCDTGTLWRFIRDVASGLAYLHSQDVVHHDIKPDNVLIAEDGTFLITDFGISTKMRTSLRRNSLRSAGEESSGGSLPYMGPEMFSGKPESVKATDIWAFGATIYEMVTGDLPFFGQGGVMQLKGAAVPELDTEDRELADLVKACMAKETWDRPTAQTIAQKAKARLSGASPEPDPKKKPGKKTGRETIRLERKPLNPDPEKPGSEAGSKESLPGLVTAAAVLCIPFSILATIPNLSWISIVGSLLSVLGSVLLLCKQKWGYYFCCTGGALIAGALSGDPSWERILFLWGGLAAIALVGWLLLTKVRNRNGKTAWEMMQARAQARTASGKPSLDKWVLGALAVIGVAGVLAGIFSNPNRKIIRQELQRDKARYNYLVSNIKKQVSAGTLDSYDVLNMQELEKKERELKELESSLALRGVKMDASRQVAEMLSGIREEFALECIQRGVQNSDSDEEMAEQLYFAKVYGHSNDVDSLYYFQAAEMNGIMWVSSVDFYREEGDVQEEIHYNRAEVNGRTGPLDKSPGGSGALTASKTDYLYMRFELKPFEGVTKRYNKHTFGVKLFTPEGRLMHGESSPRGFTYTQEVDLSSADASGDFSLDSNRVVLVGWGNDSKTAYLPGVYHVELYDGERQLFSLPVTFK